MKIYFPSARFKTGAARITESMCCGLIDGVIRAAPVLKRFSEVKHVLPPVSHATAVATLPEKVIRELDDPDVEQF